MPIPDVYLGDGVYVRDEGYGVSLDTRAQRELGRMVCPECGGTGKESVEGNRPAELCVRCSGDRNVTVNQIVLEPAILAALNQFVQRKAEADAPTPSPGE